MDACLCGRIRTKMSLTMQAALVFFGLMGLVACSAVFEGWQEMRKKEN